MLVSTSMSVRTVAELSPSSDIWPTSAPYSFTTQSPTSIPFLSPLLMVKLEPQFEALQETILADSYTKSECFSEKPSRFRKRSFSSTASRPARASSWASASCMRSDSFSALSCSYSNR